MYVAHVTRQFAAFGSCVSVSVSVYCWNVPHDPNATHSQPQRARQRGAVREGHTEIQLDIGRW